MYVQPYGVRYKHKLNYKTPTSTKYQGDLTSFSDSSSYRISSSLIIQDVKIADFPTILQGNYSSFLLAAPADPRSEIARYLGFLRGSPHKAALVYFDSAGSTGLLVPMRDNELHLTGGLDGFRCCIVNLKQKEQQPERKYSFDATIPAPSVQAPSIPERGAEQLVAASHYNDLKRERATRHLSHIFHLRNLNNVIKTEIINGAASKAKLDSINIDKKVLSGGVSVIDFGCGMGGDVFKWYKNPSGLARYVGVDIAHNSLKQFTERLVSQSQNDYRRVTHLVCADIGNESLTETQLECHTWAENGKQAGEGSWKRRVPLALTDQFDIASCQFAMHYMFQSAKQAHHFFAQIAAHLKPGGVFIATTMDCRVLAEALSEQLHGCFDESLQQDAANSLQSNENYAGIAPLKTSTSTVEAVETSADLFARIREMHLKHQAPHKDQVLSYINDVAGEVLHIKFDEEHVARLLRRNATAHQAAPPAPKHISDPYESEDDAPPPPEEDEESPYGIQYTFTLHDSLEDAAVDAPEWVVPLGQTLRDLASAHGLRLLETQNFQDILSDMIKNENKLSRMESMHVFNYKGTLSEAEWRIARLYLKLVFVKDRPGEIHAPSSPDMPPPGSPDGPPPGYHQPSSPVGPPPGFGGRFAPSSPDGPPPGAFAPSSPEGPPPGHGGRFAPSSPDGPPPGHNPFAPSSPDGPPPGHVHRPSSPDGPPPGHTTFRPSSPDCPPPGYRPSSPDSPPPEFNPFKLQPSSPEGPPPGYGGRLAPSSPDVPPPGVLAPCSPEGPPPGYNPFVMPSSPDVPPPGHVSVPLTGNKRSKSGYGSDSEDEREASKKSRTEVHNPFVASSTNPFAQTAAAPPAPTASAMYGSDDDEPRAGDNNDNIVAPADYDPYAGDSEEEELDPATALLMQIRDLATEMAGGEDAWDTLSDDQIDRFLAAARAELQWGGDPEPTGAGTNQTGGASAGGGAMQTTPDSSPPNPFTKGPSTPDAPAPGLAFAASPDSPPPNLRFGLPNRSMYESDDDTPAPASSGQDQNKKQGGVGHAQGSGAPSNPYGSDSDDDKSPSNPFVARKSDSAKPAEAAAPFHNPYGDDD